MDKLLTITNAKPTWLQFMDAKLNGFTIVSIEFAVPKIPALETTCQQVMAILSWADVHSCHGGIRALYIMLCGIVV